jgi:threonine dehydrogenase-like Zn-dependent dehydrogenase
MTPKKNFELRAVLWDQQIGSAWPGTNVPVRANGRRNKKASLVAQRRNIAVIGLGYVGLPVAVAFVRAGAKVVGFDIDRERVEELRTGFDRTRALRAP